MLQHLITHDEDLRMVPVDRDQLTSAVEEIRQNLRESPAGADPAQDRTRTRWIGIGSMVLGDHDEAHAFLRQSLDLAAAAGNTRAVIATRLNLADAHRYDGDTATAGELYRSALDTARTQAPELVDFALQHLAKHLMEQGDLTTAHTHLTEARRLRLAKGDTALVESTQAALDRVNSLLAAASTGTPETDEAQAARWSRGWTTWLQSRTTTRTPDRWPREFPAIRDAVRALTAHERLRPHHLRDELFPAGLIDAMAQEAEKTLATDGYLHNGKWNAPVGQAANRFAARVDLATLVARTTGLEVEPPHTGVYIAYLEEGQFLDVHVDEFGFGEANLILCLKHDVPAEAPTTSSTVFFTPDGHHEHTLAPGECVVFDGALTPHGRTPLSAGETVILAGFGFRARDRRTTHTVAHLPAVPD